MAPNIFQGSGSWRALESQISCSREQQRIITIRQFSHRTTGSLSLNCVLVPCITIVQHTFGGVLQFNKDLYKGRLLAKNVYHGSSDNDHMAMLQCCYEWRGGDGKKSYIQAGAGGGPLVRQNVITVIPRTQQPKLTKLWMAAVLEFLFKPPHFLMGSLWNANNYIVVGMWCLAWLLLKFRSKTPVHDWMGV